MSKTSNARNNLLLSTKQVHKVPEIEVNGEPLYFQHLKAIHNPIINKMIQKGDLEDDINTMVFALSVCDEDGNMLFTTSEEDLELIKQLNRLVVNVISNAAMMGDEKKPLGV
ncbi:conserved hypothetical protein [Vibrio chagasii]|nr:conserved hypothetical protein [Vibrio chagasii]